jgi:hypothetical protein
VCKLGGLRLTYAPLQRKNKIHINLDANRKDQEHDPILTPFDLNIPKWVREVNLTLFGLDNVRNQGINNIEMTEWALALKELPRL